MSVRWTDSDLKAVGWTGTGFGNRRRVFEAPDGSLVDSRHETVQKVGKKQGPAAPDRRRINSKQKVDPSLPSNPPERLEMTGNMSLDKAIKKIAKMTRDPAVVIKQRPAGTSKTAVNHLRKLEREAGRDLFIRRCVAYGLPAPTPEYIFHPGRMFRWDFCWIAQKVAVEVQGGLWSKGQAKAAHALPLGILRDYEKSNLGQLSGWTVLFYTPSQLRTALPEIKRALGAA